MSSKAMPPLGVSVSTGVWCDEVYGTAGVRDGQLIGYAIRFSGKSDAYLRRQEDGWLIHIGSFDRQDDALEAIFREV